MTLFELQSFLLEDMIRIAWDGEAESDYSFKFCHLIEHIHTSDQVSR